MFERKIQHEFFPPLSTCSLMLSGKTQQDVLKYLTRKTSFFWGILTTTWKLENNSTEIRRYWEYVLFENFDWVRSRLWKSGPVPSPWEGSYKYINTVSNVYGTESWKSFNLSYTKIEKRPEISIGLLCDFRAIKFITHRLQKPPSDT